MSLAEYAPTTTGTYTYSLITGAGDADNASFSIRGDILETSSVFDALVKTTYYVLVGITDQNGVTTTKQLTITVQPEPYTLWKFANFGSAATVAAISGDLIDSQNDGLPNLLKYALGKSPNAPATTGITLGNNGTTFTMNYTLASAATDVSTHAWWTPDITNPAAWTTSGVTETMLSDNGTLQRWQATVPMRGNAKISMRLVVTEP